MAKPCFLCGERHDGLLCSMELPPLSLPPLPPPPPPRPAGGALGGLRGGGLPAGEIPAILQRSFNPPPPPRLIRAELAEPTQRLTYSISMRSAEFSITTAELEEYERRHPPRDIGQIIRESMFARERDELAKALQTRDPYPLDSWEE